ncbi:MAG: class I SAM-dependent methyltransferase [Chloroflexi bacterium]|nr:class I SAM-dependent methyltransferase [Chloroflexota bacterium]
MLLTGAERIAALGYDYDAQPKESVSHCDLCGGDLFVVVAHGDRYGFRAEAHGCARCGLVFLNPRMTADAYADFYRETYRPLVSAHHGHLIDAETVELEQAPYAENVADFLASFVIDREVSSILDVGGSTGVVTEAVARRFGLRAALVDPAPAEVERARRRGIDAVVGTIEGFDGAGRVFDLVLLCQTIDHLLDVHASLAKLRSLLAADGLFFVDIVDFQAACLQQPTVEDAVKIDHPCYLTESTAEAYLARTGFRWLRKDYAGDGLHVGYVCERCDPDPAALPATASVDRLFHEIRRVHNRPSP